MAVTQTLNITDNSGKTYTTMEELITQLNADVPMTDAISTMVESCTADGTLVNTSELSEAGTGVTITRVWDDACWTNFSALEGVDASVFADAGWTVVSEDNPALPGLTTRQDDTFGQ